MHQIDNNEYPDASPAVTFTIPLLDYILGLRIPEKAHYSSMQAEFLPCFTRRADKCEEKSNPTKGDTEPNTK